MSKNFKAEAYSRIFEEARDAKEVKGKPNTYDPDNYNKVRAQTLLMGLTEDSEYLVPKIPIGAVEMDGNGNLKAIARNRPAMLDLNFYTRNRYEVETVIPANEKKMGRERGTYILVLIGNPIVRAIADTIELPKTIRAFRFKREEVEVEAEKVMAQNLDGEEVSITSEEGLTADADGKINIEPVNKGEKVKTVVWRYVGAEMIPSSRAYKMTKSLDIDSMLELLPQIEAGILSADDEVVKDSLDEIR